MANTVGTIDNELHMELIELMEDTISHFCQENMVSGEMAWLITQCYATAKIEQFRGNVK